jgi:hypothetical protein
MMLVRVLRKDGTSYLGEVVQANPRETHRHTHRHTLFVKGGRVVKFEHTHLHTHTKGSLQFHAHRHTAAQLSGVFHGARTAKPRTGLDVTESEREVRRYQKDYTLTRPTYH